MNIGVCTVLQNGPLKTKIFLWSKQVDPQKNVELASMKLQKFLHPYNQMNFKID